MVFINYLTYTKFPYSPFFPFLFWQVKTQLYSDSFLSKANLARYIKLDISKKKKKKEKFKMESNFILPFLRSSIC